jgi:hypothetical protein
MENLKDKQLNKYHVTIYFEMDEQFMTLVPPHRLVINNLIEKNIIDTYSVSLDSQRSWIVINAASKAEVRKILSKSPLYKYWVIEVDDIIVYDGQIYRLPALQLN